jgi:hypothetical protein
MKLTLGWGLDIAPPFLSSALERDDLSVLHPGYFNPGRKHPWYIGGWMGPYASLGISEFQSTEKSAPKGN